MGLVLGSSVLIAAERENRPVSLLLQSLSAEHFETEFLLSAISVIELDHGWHRANSPEAAAKRRRAGRQGRCRVKEAGLVIATADLLIGITALHLDYAIGTRNLRHFEKIPGLTVLPI